MKRALTAIAAAGVLALASTCVTSDAEAQGRCRGCGVGLGIIGGLAAGAIIGGAVAGAAAGPYAPYAPVPGYAVYPGYGAPIPVGCPGGYWARRPMIDQWGNVVGYSRPRFFCP